MVISGCVGPRGDGYDPGQVMSEAEAEAYHRQQISAFGETDADLVTAITMTNTPEAIGLVRAAAGVRFAGRHRFHRRNRWPLADWSGA